MSSFLVIAIAAAAAAASPIGGLIALWRKPTPLFMSLALLFATGVLFATICFEMMPQAYELGEPIVTLAFAGGGFAAHVIRRGHRGKLVGEKADHQQSVDHYYRRPPRGDQATVLAGGTSAEELIKGLSIGVGSAIRPGLGVIIALAIVIDKIAEALSIGELIHDQSREEKKRPIWRVLKWTGLIRVSLFGSALVGWFALRDLPEPVLGFLCAAVGGGMSYLTATDFMPLGEVRSAQPLEILALGAGFMTIFALGHFY